MFLPDPKSPFPLLSLRHVVQEVHFVSGLPPRERKLWALERLEAVRQPGDAQRMDSWAEQMRQILA